MDGGDCVRSVKVQKTRAGGLGEGLRPWIILARTYFGSDYTCVLIRMGFCDSFLGFFVGLCAILSVSFEGFIEGRVWSSFGFW